MAFLKNIYSSRLWRVGVFTCFIACIGSSSAFAGSGLFVPISRSSVVVMPGVAKEVVVANPDIADVHVNNENTITVIGKLAGKTNIRVFSGSGKLLQTLNVSVGYDLPAIRHALKKFIPDETIGVEMINTSVALTGYVRNNSSVDRALKIVQEYITNASGVQKGQGDQKNKSKDATEGSAYPKIMNMLKLVSGQQVMIRVRVAEVNRDALKRLGVDPQAVFNSGNFAFSGALGTATEGITAGSTAAWRILDDQYRGTGFLRWNGSDRSLGAAINMLERDGLVKTLAEPNLVAVSGEEAEFLAGGEIPVVAPSSATPGSPVSVTVEYKPIGVSVKFTPDILSENRIRMKVQPEVSEVSDADAVLLSGFRVPSISTRRAKTVVELAPGESFMIAGLLKDETRSSIDQLPGIKEVPVLGALFRSTEFQRNESELVIAVTPYIVDPLKSSDVKLPTDDFRPASQMEMFFYGALGSVLTDKRSAFIPKLEGPTGFMVD
ncbi:MAG: type II and III secretion system protein family protein [Rickettsiales bacterium]